MCSGCSNGRTGLSWVDLLQPSARAVTTAAEEAPLRDHNRAGGSLRWPVRSSGEQRGCLSPPHGRPEWLSARSCPEPGDRSFDDPRVCGSDRGRFGAGEVRRIEEDLGHRRLVPAHGFVLPARPPFERRFEGRLRVGAGGVAGRPAGGAGTTVSSAASQEASPVPGWSGTLTALPSAPGPPRSSTRPVPGKSVSPVSWRLHVNTAGSFQKSAWTPSP